MELPRNFVFMTILGSHPCCIDYGTFLSRFLWPCRDKFQVATRTNWNAIFALAWSQCCFVSACWSWNGWSLESSKSNWMNQHCQRDMTNTPSRPMKLLGSPRVPRAVSDPPPPPLTPAGWTQVPGTCGFDSWECSWEHCGNLRFMPYKQIGFHEKFLGICSFRLFGAMKINFGSQELFAMFPGTCSKIPRNGSWDVFSMFPGGPIQAGPWMGLVCRKIWAWNHEWIWDLKVLSNGLPLMMVIPENERSGNNPT